MCKNIESPQKFGCEKRKKFTEKTAENEKREKDTKVLIEDDESVTNKLEWAQDLEL